MKNKEKKNAEDLLIETLDHALLGFHLLLEEKQIEELEQGIYKLIEKLDNPEINHLLDRYPDLLQEHGLEDLLRGDLEILNANSFEVKTAGLMSCLLLLITFCAKLVSESGYMTPLSSIDKSSLPLQTIHYITDSISLEEFKNHLMMIILSVVRVEYYETFKAKIGEENFSNENIFVLDSDPELKEHLDCMLWFALIRVFLESVYFYFNNRTYNTKTILP